MNSKKPLRICPVCRGTISVEVIHTQKFVLPDDHFLPREYDLVACSVCGFVYADTPASQDVYDAYYACMSQYDRDYINQDTRLYTDTVAWLDQFIHDKKSAIIEVGCGNGQLLTELQRAGFSDLTALDPSEVCVEAVRAKGITGLCGSLSEAYCDRQYDCIILQGVLEHIYDIPKTMSIVRTLSKLGGLVFIGVPDASRYGNYDTIPYDYLNIEHINHFEETSLINLGFLYGFDTVGFLKSILRLSHVEQPVIFCMYQKTDKEKTAKWPDHARQAIIEYIAVTQANQVSARIIEELAETAEPIVVWGAGNFTCRLLATSKLGQCNIIMFIDNDRHKQKMNIHSKSVCAPEVLFKLPKKVSIVVAVAVFPDEIIAQINSMGLNNRVVVLK